MTSKYKLAQSESGDWFIIPEESSVEAFLEDELDGQHYSYAFSVDLSTLRLIDWE